MKKKALDRLHLLVYGLSIVGWGALFYSLLVFDQARPEMSTVVTAYFDVPMRSSWLAEIYNRLEYLLWFCALTSFLNLLLNGYLNVTHKERISFGIVLLFAVSSVAILILKIWQPVLA